MPNVKREFLDANQRSSGRSRSHLKCWMDIFQKDDKEGDNWIKGAFVRQKQIYGLDEENLCVSKEKNVYLQEEPLCKGEFS